MIELKNKNPETNIFVGTHSLAKKHMLMTESIPKASLLYFLQLSKEDAFRICISKPTLLYMCPTKCKLLSLHIFD